MTNTFTRPRAALELLDVQPVPAVALSGAEIDHQLYCAHCEACAGRRIPDAPRAALHAAPLSPFQRKRWAATLAMEPAPTLALDEPRRP